MSVDSNLSDLFFNYADAGEALSSYCNEQMAQKKNIIREDLFEKMKEPAQEFITYYSGILSCEIPTVDELAQDFVNRV